MSVHTKISKVNMVSNNIFEDIKNQANIVDIVSRRVNLKKKGGEWVGLCPFHNDSNPSMFVSERKQLYKCFSCGAGGDVFKFIMEYDKLEFKEAVKQIAAFYHIDLPEKFSFRQAKKVDPHFNMKTINQWACKVYHQYLFTAKVAEPARSYLKKRKISGKAIKTFQIGYAPDSHQGFLIRLIHHQGLFKQMKWSNASLFIQQQHIREFFRNRIIFPIVNEKNEVLGFGGRTISQDEPKYLNVRESPWFKKREILYGFKESYAHIIKSKEVYVVEGYLDVIACYEVDVPAVAPLGTALTREQILKLKRYVERVNLLFDGDEAGRRAAWKSAQDLAALSVEGFVYTLPLGKDPFDFIKGTSSDDITGFFSQKGVNVYQYLINAVTENKNNWSPVEKKQSLEKLLPVYFSIQDKLIKKNFADMLGEAFSLNIDEWLKDTPNHYQSNKVKQSFVKVPSSGANNNLIRKERSFVLFLCSHPEYIRSAGSAVSINNLSDSLARYIYDRLLSFKTDVNFQMILDVFRSEGHHQVAEYISHHCLKKDYEENKRLDDGGEKTIYSSIEKEKKDLMKKRALDEFNGRVVILKKEYLKKQKNILDEKIKKARESQDWDLECSLQEEKMALHIEEDNLTQYFEKL